MQFRADRGGIIHGSVGKVGFEPTHIKENIEALIGDLKKAKPASAKGVYLQGRFVDQDAGPRVAGDARHRLDRAAEPGGRGERALGVEDVAAACERIRARGGVVTRDAGPVKGGSTIIAFVEDPDGYKIELIQRA